MSFEPFLIAGLAAIQQRQITQALLARRGVGTYPQYLLRLRQEAVAETALHPEEWVRQAADTPQQTLVAIHLGLFHSAVARGNHAGPT